VMHVGAEPGSAGPGVTCLRMSEAHTQQRSLGYDPQLDIFRHLPE